MLAGVAIIILFTVSASAQFANISPQFIELLLGIGLGVGIGVWVFGAIGIIGACWQDWWRKVWMFIFIIGMIALLCAFIVGVILFAVLYFSKLGLIL